MKKYLLILFVFFPLSLIAQMRVVSTLATYADIAKSIGGDLVSSTYIASPRFNPHFIEPKPSDVLKVKRADLFIHSGLDLESWRDPLIDAAANPEVRKGGLRQLDLSTNIALLEVSSQQVSRAEGDIHSQGNPHYWMDPRNGLIIAQAIATKMSQLDAANAATYSANLNSFSRKLKMKIQEWENKLAQFKGRELLGYHNEWIYLVNFAGLKMQYFMEPKPGIPPTAKHIEFLTQYAKANKVAAIVQATYFPTEVSQTVADNSGAKVLIFAQSVGEVDQAGDYIAMLDYDIGQLVRALS